MSEVNEWWNDEIMRLVHMNNEEDGQGEAHRGG